MYDRYKELQAKLDLTREMRVVPGARPPQWQWKITKKSRVKVLEQVRDGRCWDLDHCTLTSGKYGTGLCGGIWGGVPWYCVLRHPWWGHMFNVNSCT